MSECDDEPIEGVSERVRYFWHCFMLTVCYSALGLLVLWGFLAILRWATGYGCTCAS